VCQFLWEKIVESKWGKKYDAVGRCYYTRWSKIDVNHPPQILGQAKQEIITWVSFNFQSNNEPVLPLLEKALDGIKKIVNELSNM
jgi:hypothetical protein